jgi:hypothetical protein
MYAILERYFALDEICHAHQWRQFLNIPFEQRGKYRLIRGHFHHCLHQLLPAKPIYMTILREPVARALSRYQHFKRDTAHYLYERARNMSLAEFLRDPLTRAQIHNLQTRHIAYDFDLKALTSDFDPISPHVMALEEKINEMFSELSDDADDSLLRVAKQRLDEFAFVGIVERFDESMALMTSVFGWEQIKEYEARNTAPKSLCRKDISKELLNEIEELNQADIALYKHACRLFEARLEKVGSHA